MRKRNRDSGGMEVRGMECVLMHKRIPVADIVLDDATGYIQRIGTVHTPEHMPVGVAVRHGMPDRASLNDWWTERSIPASRSGIREALETLEISSPRQLLVRCYGLSLSDQYWIRPCDTDLTWDDINFFEHPFSDDIGDVLFGTRKQADVLDFSSPDNTSTGNLKKRWKIVDGRRVLFKGGSNPFRQQPFNEVIASRIMDRLEISHVSYDVVWDHDMPYSLCEDFVTPVMDLIPAWQIMQTKKKTSDVSVYRHLINCAAALGVPDPVPFLDRMIVLDYLIANEDRHLNNFGALRNAETLEWIGMAPMFDCGSSLGYDKVANEIRSGKNMICKPFKKHHEEQLKLVTDFSWIRFDRLLGIRELIRDTFSENSAVELIDEHRIAAIADSVEQRSKYLQELSLSKGIRRPDSVEDDVIGDVAEKYD